MATSWWYTQEATGPSGSPLIPVLIELRMLATSLHDSGNGDTCSRHKCPHADLLVGPFDPWSFGNPFDKMNE